MHIVHYNLTTTSKEGGVETFVWKLAEEQARRGQAVTVVGGTGHIDPGIKGIRVLRFPFIDRATWRVGPLRKHYELTKLLERLSLLPAALPSLLAARPDIVHLHKPYDFVVAPFLRRRGARVVYHGHGRDFYPADRFFVRSIDGMLSCSRYNANEVAQRYGVQPAVVYNGFDPSHFSPRPPDPALRDKLVAPGERAILFAGRMQPWKGVQYAVEALPLVDPNVRVRLLIGGDGDYRSALERLVRKLGLGERVSFLGTIPHADLPAYFALADVVVGASFASETFGMVLCEALGSARPVIASDWEGYREVVIPDVTGLVVPARQPAALARAIERMLASPAQAHALAERGRQHVLQQFTWEAVADRVEQLYEHVLEHR